MTMDGENGVLGCDPIEPLEIIHINLRNTYNASYSIGEYVGSKRSIIASLNEPKSNSRRVYNIDAFDEIIRYNPDDQNKEIKAAIGIKGIYYRIIFEHLSNPNLAVAGISKNSAKIIFISGYFPPSEDINIGLNDLNRAIR